MEINHNNSAIENHDTINWYDHFLNFKKSGLSKAAYAKQNNIIKHRFIYWCRKFEVREPKKSVKSSAKNNFVALKVKSTVAFPVEILCTLEIDSRSKILVHDLSALKTILASLELKPCS